MKTSYCTRKVGDVATKPPAKRKQKIDRPMTCSKLKISSLKNKGPGRILTKATSRPKCSGYFDIKCTKKVRNLNYSSYQMMKLSNDQAIKLFM